MNKKARVSIINSNDNYEYIVDIEKVNNKINYQEDNTNVLYDIDNKLLIRDNKEMYMELDFVKEIGNIYMKELKKSIDINLKVNKIISDENHIEIQYKLENEIYKYSISME